MQFNRKVHANSPALTAGSGVLQLASTAAAGASLTAAIATANPNANINEVNGLLISASSGNPVYIRTTGGADSTGVFIPAGQNLFLPIAEWPAVELEYQCASAVSVLVFLARMPRFNNT
ncbi:MAG: hypothetical protein Unbinned5179contig1001_33 [Prokaryotic dsDNA virus sp.]|nr:MAG: hypothetical protein Unbinned5179contig1001_33 [Prokaryotic dsDNA virus sp.]|tara:strand:+ start:9612 stop:9968 length:357 start_codon:yes stop_codon:yes gene_type:complete